MDALTAHARLALSKDRSALDAIEPMLRYVPAWPALATGAAACSGQLEECQSDDDLLAAVQHGASLVSAGVIDWEQIKLAGCAVIDELLRVCQHMGQPLDDDARELHGQAMHREFGSVIDYARSIHENN